VGERGDVGAEDAHRARGQARRRLLGYHGVAVANAEALAGKADDAADLQAAPGRRLERDEVAAPRLHVALDHQPRAAAESGVHVVALDLGDVERDHAQDGHRRAEPEDEQAQDEQDPLHDISRSRAATPAAGSSAPHTLRITATPSAPAAIAAAARPGPMPPKANSRARTDRAAIAARAPASAPTPSGVPFPGTSQIGAR